MSGACCGSVLLEEPAGPLMTPGPSDSRPRRRRAVTDGHSGRACGAESAGGLAAGSAVAGGCGRPSAGGTPGPGRRRRPGRRGPGWRGMTISPGRQRDEIGRRTRTISSKSPVRGLSSAGSGTMGASPGATTAAEARSRLATLAGAARSRRALAASEVSAGASAPGSVPPAASRSRSAFTSDGGSPSSDSSLSTSAVWMRPTARVFCSMNSRVRARKARRSFAESRPRAATDTRLR